VAATTSPVRLVLASASPARRELLARTGLPFEVIPANVNEPVDSPDPRTLVQSAAWLKAADVAPKVDRGLVLSADTIGWLDGGPLLKPADEADARRMLRAMAGREHDLWTGVVLWRRPDDLQFVWQEQTRVAFAPLSDEELDRYLASRSWRGHSGSYAIQEKDDPYVRVVRGSLSNVIGLPMESLLRVLAWLGAAPK
jgi:septum formation protein